MPDDDLRLALVLDQVRGREPVDERERRACAEVLRRLARLRAPFDRDAGQVHITGSGVVAGPRGVLLLRHKKLGIWVQPGGHLEPGELPWEAARREATEETGLELALDGVAVPALLHVDVHPAGDHVHLDLRYGLTVVGDDRPHPPPGESQDVAWMGWDEAQATTDAGLAGLLASMAPR